MFNLLLCEFIRSPSRKTSRCLAIAFPSCVRSIIISLSNSAKPLIIVSINLPVGVSSTNPIFKTCNFTLLSNNAFTVLIASTVERAKLSNLVTTNVSPSTSFERTSLNFGLSALVPVNFSE